jgi:hypothetical protein
MTRRSDMSVERSRQTMTHMTGRPEMDVGRSGRSMTDMTAERVLPTRARVPAKCLNGPQLELSR